MAFLKLQLRIYNIYCLDAVFACGGNYHGQCGTACLDACSVRELTEVPAISSKIKQVNDYGNP